MRTILSNFFVAWIKTHCTLYISLQILWHLYSWMARWQLFRPFLIFRKNFIGYKIFFGYFLAIF
jgi:hypothetical protein